MILTHEQKRYIKRNIPHKPVNEIAAHLGVSENDIQAYVKKMWGEEKFVRHLNKTEQPHKEPEPAAGGLRSLLKSSRFQMLFLILLVWSVFGFSLWSDFVSDDVGIIRDRPDIGDITAPFRYGPMSFLRDLIYFFVHAVFGRNPAAYHALNVLVHSANTVLFYIVVSLTINPSVGFLAACLFGVHSIISEPVLWISGGTYAQYTFFLYLSLFFLILHLKNHRMRYYVFSLLSIFGALLSAAISMVFPAIVTLYVFVFSDLKKYWKKLIPYYLITGIWVIFWITRMAWRIQTVQHEQFREDIGFNPFFQIPIAISSYFELFFWPDKLSIYHSDFIMSPLLFAIRIGIALLFFALLIYTFFKHRKLFYGLAFFIIAIAPTLTPFGISSLMTERYVYFGSTGLFFITGYLVWKLSRRKSFETATYIVFMTILVLLAVRSLMRVADWRNEEKLWTATARTAKYDPVNHMNLGDIHRKKRDYEEAVKEFNIALQLSPNNAYAYYNMGLTYTEAGNAEQALQSYQKAVKIDPNLWQGYQNMGVVYFNLGDHQQALEQMKKALALMPNEAQLHANMGLIYANIGMKQEAIQAFRRTLELDPKNQKAQAALVQLSSKN